jgi:hypothetical protein
MCNRSRSRGAALLVETGIHEEIGDERVQPLLLEEIWGILASWQRRSREAPAGASTRIWRSGAMLLLLYLEAATRAAGEERCEMLDLDRERIGSGRDNRAKRFL